MLPQTHGAPQSVWHVVWFSPHAGWHWPLPQAHGSWQSLGQVF
jgi:hypothetical protein